MVIFHNYVSLPEGKTLGFGWNSGYYHQKSDVVVGPLTVNHVSMRVRNRGSHFVDSHSFMSFFLGPHSHSAEPGRGAWDYPQENSMGNPIHFVGITHGKTSRNPKTLRRIRSMHCSHRTAVEAGGSKPPNLFGMNIPKSQQMGAGKPKRLAGSNDPSFAVIARIWTRFMGRRNPDLWWVSLLGGGMLGTCIMNIVIQID